MTILDLLPSAGLKYVAGTSGGEFAGACPLCGGTDRFRCWPHHPSGATGGKFMCRGCGRSGDAIAFIMECDGVGYVEACRRLGTTPRPGRRSMVPMQKAAWSPKPSLLPCPDWQATAAAFVEYAAGVMAISAEGQAYALGRGLTPETIQACRVGWNPRMSRDPRESWGLPPEVNAETGNPKTVWLPRGLVVPSFRAGAVTAIKIRRPDWREGDPAPKYAWTVGGCMSPMTLGVAPGQPVAVVEGELDALLIHQAAGDLVTAMAMRSAKNKPDASAHALLNAAPLILVALDADEAGREGWLWWRATYPQAKRLPPILGKDPGESLKAGLDLRVWIQVGLTPQPQRRPEPIHAPARRDELPAWAR
ncbi:MAG: CHC2 zinc finger domain-containing protein [Solidesulfovibrio sp.]|uniref:CHC2 zinc finger domain-containing protein n=1 Tax=Solidesulfovibrio sp. TaxID=2910990 RepID=UPI002B20E67C|nr:CHC2 zinc finger domain-containing protein [Solidesulfovibrio sp.]MEA4857748.1 primase-helicase zinc-binding domain-containing protein [Solidesulfovibrio sp.]